MNVEGMYSIYFIKRWSEAKPPFEILRFDIRYSAVRCPASQSYMRDGWFHVSAQPLNSAKIALSGTDHTPPERDNRED